MEIVSKILRTLTKVFSDANLFSNLVTIDLLSELYLMEPLLLLVTNSNRLIRCWITARPEPERQMSGLSAPTTCVVQALVRVEA